MVPDHVVEQGCIEDRRCIELLAGDRGPDDRKNARSDHRADAEGGERERAESLL